MPEPGRRHPGALPAAMVLAASFAGLPLAHSRHADDIPPRSIADFRPSEHGFRFTNGFSGSPLPQGFQSLGAAVGAPSRYGLCGGMSFASADFFLARRPIPATSTIPRHGEPLYDYIYRRQVESFDGLSAPLRFGDWMSRPDHGPLGTRRLTLDALPGMIRELDQGKPVVLGLVHARSGQPLWHNHQVLALAAARIDTDARPGWSLRVYDPNHPLNDRVAVRSRLVLAGTFQAPGLLSVHVPVLGVESTLESAEMLAPPPGRKARSKVVRGMFAMPYAPVLPPEGLGGRRGG